MPHHPTEENAPSHIYDQVAKESDNSTASDHSIHDEKKATDKAKASDHQSKGPQIVEKIEDAPSKDELKAKAAKMNE